MRAKDVIKTAIAVVSSYILMACGQKKSTPEEPNERPLTEAAHGDTRQTLFDIVPENGEISFSDAKKLIDSQSGEQVSNNLIKQLQNAGIEITKKGENGEDSLLYSAVRTEENGTWKWGNASYTLNKKTGNTEQVGDLEVKRKDSSQYPLNPKTIGVKEVTSKVVSEEIVKARTLVLDRATASQLNENDTVMVGNTPAVFKDNKLKVEETTIQNTKKDTFIFDYQKR